ncbi:hypothetical protein H0X06_01855 [Candidatus Dependentiae bacterium]|nr:hypothetical protein [Candidatus Dependentiae bacterium]
MTIIVQCASLIVGLHTLNLFLDQHHYAHLTSVAIVQQCQEFYEVEGLLAYAKALCAINKSMKITHYRLQRGNITVVRNENHTVALEVIFNKKTYKTLVHSS